MVHGFSNATFYIYKPRPVTRNHESDFLLTIIFNLSKVLSGDSVVIRGQPRGGPPPERQLCLSNVNAPKLARRSNPNVEASVETRDEVCVFLTLLHSSAMPSFSEVLCAF